MVESFRWNFWLVEQCEANYGQAAVSTLLRNTHNAVWMSQYSDQAVLIDDLFVPSFLSLCLVVLIDFNRQPAPCSPVCLFFVQGGMGGMEHSKAMLEAAVSDRAPDLCPGWVRGIVGHSVDIDKNCQRVLCSNEDGALHVFPDLLQLLTLDARVAVLKVMDTSSLELKPLIAKYKAMPKMPQPVRGKQRAAACSDAPGDAPQTKDDIKKVINQLGSTLLDKLMARMDAFENLFVEQATCCKHHSKKCDVFPAALLQTDSERVAQATGVAKLTDPLLIYMAGTSCQDWSSMSQVLSLAGKTVLPFAVELQLIGGSAHMCTFMSARETSGRQSWRSFSLATGCIQ